MWNVFGDVWQAAKATTRRRGVSLTIVAALTLGIGLAIATFTLVDAILLRPLPYPKSDELLSMYGEFRPESGYNFSRFALSAPEVADYQNQSRTVDVAGWEFDTVALDGADGTSEPLSAIRATSQVFNLLQTPALLGRTLTVADDAKGAPCAAVISYGLWVEKFQESSTVLGRTIRLSGRPCEIVGVMPPRFAFPGESTRLWLPLALDPDPNTRGNHGMYALGRIRRGATLSEAQSEREILMSAWARENSHHLGHGVVLAPLKADVAGPVSQQLLVLASAVAFVLVVIAANMASLMLAHGEARRRELAVRSALGAARSSLVRQLVWEGLLLSLTGGIAGAALAWISISPLIAAYPQRLPRASEVSIDLRVAGMAALTSIVIGVVIGLLPAIRLTRLNVADALKSGERGEGLSLSIRTHGWLVTTELALAVAVTSGAVLLAQSFVNLQRVPLGFDPIGVTAAFVSLPDLEAPPPTEAPLFFASVLERVRVLPGVQSAGAISHVPFMGNPPPDDFMIDGRPTAPPTKAGFNAHYIQATPGALEALGVRIMRGRGIGPQDQANAEAVALINETAARTYWPDADPLGGRVRYPTGVVNGQWAGWTRWLTIVGVVDDVRFASPAMPARPAIYVALAQLPRAVYDGRTMAVVVRTRGARQDLAAALRSVAIGVNAGSSISRVRAMDTVVSTALARPRFMGWLMGVFAAVSLLVASLGVYAVIAYGVQRRRREIGVRLALGATRERILSLVARQTLAMGAIGLLLGFVLAAWLATSMSGLLFGVGTFELRVYAAVAAVFTLTLLLAVVVPARRALRVDPLIALRTE